MEDKKLKKKKSLIKKLAIWVPTTIILIIVLIFLLLSVLFPSSYVKKIIVENMQMNLKRDVTLKDFDFNVFTGIKIKELVIKERDVFNSGNPFVKVESLTLDYSILPLLFGKLKINEATLKGAEVYLVAKKIDDKIRFNFDDLFKIDMGATKEEEKEEKKSEEIKKPELPIVLELGKVGFENLKIDIRDFSNPLLPMGVTADKITGLIKNFYGFEKPFDIEAGIQLSVFEILKDNNIKKSFNIWYTVNGKVKPFDRIRLNPELSLKTGIKNLSISSGFFMKLLENGLKLIASETSKYIEANKDVIKLKISKEVEPYKQKYLEEGEKQAEKLKEKLGASKEKLNKKKEEILKEYEQTINKESEPIINKVLSEVNSLPEAVRGKAKEEILKAADSIKSEGKKELAKSLDSTINNLEKEYQNFIVKAKASIEKGFDKLLGMAIDEAMKELKKLAESLKNSDLGLDTLDAGIEINNAMVNILMKNWIVNITDINIESKLIGLKGKSDFDVVNSKGNVDLILKISKELDKIKLFTPFLKDDGYEYIPLALSFDTKTNTYTINNQVFDKKNIEEFAVNYGKDYAKRILGGDKSSKTEEEKEDDKNEKNMENIANNSKNSTLDKINKLKEIPEKYKKVEETTKKASKTVNKIKKAF